MSNDAVGRTPFEEYICPYCGRIVREYEYNMTAALRSKLNETACFQCLSWLNFHRNPQPHQQVINNQLFNFPPIVKEGGRKRRILTTSGEVIASTEYFNYGQVPERFRHLFPATAHFVNGILAIRLGAYKYYECFKKGCWDRRHCLFYKCPEMDWNEIPADYKEGGEHCPIYINYKKPYGK